MNWIRILAVVLVASGIVMLAGVRPARSQNSAYAKRISAHLANEVIELPSFASTVAGFLSELSITLPPGTKIEPPLEAALKDGMNVFLTGLTVTRGEYVTEIPSEVEFIETWYNGPEKIELAHPGQSGLLKASLTIFYCGDKEVGRRQQMEVIREMKPQKVVCYISLSSEDGPSVDEILAMRAKPNPYAEPPPSYVEKRSMIATAYEPGPVSCGRFASGSTSIGLKAGYGVVAVDPTVIPMGTRLFIEGYGYAVAGDVGSAIKDNRIDVGMLTVEECFKWGRKTVDVYILH